MFNFFFLPPFLMDFRGGGDWFWYIVSYIPRDFMDHNICKLGGHMV